MKKVSFYVTGNVQDVMFRQTFIRGAQKRKIRGGATNDPKNHQLVHCSLAGEESVVEEMLSKLQEGKPLNSWNAQVDELHYHEQFIEFSDHQVTTDNVNDYHWSPSVIFYL
ncbi:MAG: acylphosphatase [Betaproteobacteria bacterium]|nr:acylphosphatase [Betaproteobacteria bacterium]